MIRGTGGTSTQVEATPNADVKKPAHPLTLHRSYQPGHRAGDQVAGLEGQANAEGTDHRVVPAHRVGECLAVVEDVSRQDPKAVVGDGQALRVAHEGRHLVTLLQRLGDHLSSGGARGTEHQNPFARQ